MKKRKLTYKVYFMTVIIALIAFYCMITLRSETISHPAIYSMQWNQINGNAEFPGKSGHTCVVFKNKIWVIGGWNGKNVKNDVWSSSDGLNWECAVKEAPFHPRAGHTCVIYKDKIWIIGGLFFDKNRNIKDLNDVWFSPNGKSWFRAVKNAPFSPRGGHSSIVFKDKIWVIGGIACGADVWYSSNGIQWFRASERAEFDSRGGHATIVYNDRIWIIGGIYVDKDNNFKSLSDVWSSYDGITWEKTAEKTSFFAGGGHASVNFHNRMWVIGGFRKGGPVYTSTDGINWEKINETGDFGERVSHSCVVFNDKIWVIGGYNGQGHKNDVWQSAL